MINICDEARFIKTARRKMQQGKYSREPLKLLRLEWRSESIESIECDWLMRPSDEWDKDLPEHLARENQTLQALRDAMSLRDLIFESFPEAMNAELRMYRYDGGQRLELMMTGSVSRTNEVFHRVSSVAMRAKLCGFEFVLSDGVLDRPLAA
jgi:hypothetical protein